MIIVPPWPIMGGIIIFMMCLFSLWQKAERRIEVVENGQDMQGHPVLLKHVLTLDLNIRGLLHNDLGHPQGDKIGLEA